MGIFLCGVNINTKPGTSTTNNFSAIAGFAGNSNSAAESRFQQKQYIAGTFANFGVAVDNGGTGRAAHTRKGSVNGNLSPTITDSVAGAYFDTTNSDAVAANDLWNTQLIVGSTSTTTFWWQTMQFTATSGHVGMYGGFCSSSRGSSRFAPLNGNNAAAAFTSETQAQVSVRVAGVWKNISVNVLTNTQNGSTAVKSRVGGANGGTSFSIASGSGAGIFDDGGSGSDTLSSGNLICVSIDTSASSSGSFSSNVSSTIAATSGSASDMWIAGSNLSRAASASTHYNQPIGNNSAWTNTTESLTQQVQPNFAFKVSNFRVKAFTNTYTGSATVTLRKNGSDVITLTITAGSTAEVEDSSTVVSFTASDNFDISVTGGSSGALVFQYFGYVLNTFRPGWTAGATRMVGGAFR